ncbi:unnamed protein product, partial [Phaeothamnion confervicola]
MFYSSVILAKKSPLGKIWMAAHWERKLSKTQIFQTNIMDGVQSIVNPTVPLALRMSGHLLLGLVRIYSRKVRYLMTDCTEALTKIKLAFRPGVVDLPAGASEAPAASINVLGFGEFDVNLDLPDPFALDALPATDEWMAASAGTVARRQDITLDSVESTSRVAADGRGFLSGFDDGDSWMTLGAAVDGRGGISSDRPASRSRDSRYSDIEAARHADSSGVSRRARMSIDAATPGSASGLRDRGRSLSLGAGAAAIDDLGPAMLPADLDADLALPPEDDLGPPMPPGFDDDLMPPPGAADFDVAPPLPGVVRMDDSIDADARVSAGVGAVAAHSSPEAAAVAKLVAEAEQELPGFEPLDMEVDAEAGARLGAAAKAAREEEEEEKYGAARAKPKAKPKPRRTRKRKLELDATLEIDSAAMKRQLVDTSDIVRRRTLLLPGVAASAAAAAADALRPSVEERLAAPLLSGLAPELVEMLGWTAEPAPLPFLMPRLRRVAAAAEEHPAPAAAAGGRAAQEEKEADEEEEEEEAGAAAAAGTGKKAKKAKAMVDDEALEEAEEDVEMTRRGRRCDSLLSAAPEVAFEAGGAAEFASPGFEMEEMEPPPFEPDQGGFEDQRMEPAGDRSALGEAGAA